jgi:DNA-binding CsgD family transcriptional regulator
MLQWALGRATIGPVEAFGLKEATRLTPREREVLELVARGTANKRIAGMLGMSEHTVKFHLGSVFRKLGVTNRTEAATTYLRALAER